MTHHHASWLRSLVSPDVMKKTINILQCWLIEDKRNGLHIDAIAVRGISGAVIGGALANMANLPLIVVRKQGDNSHSDFMVEFDEELISSGTRYVFVDDLITSGNTFNETVKAIDREIGAKCVSIYLYHDYNGIKWRDTVPVRADFIE